MILETVCTLNYGQYNDEDKIITEGDTIKVFLYNGEILIGEYENSDKLSLTIERGYESIEIDFENVKDIELLLGED